MISLGYLSVHLRSKRYRLGHFRHTRNIHKYLAKLVWFRRTLHQCISAIGKLRMTLVSLVNWRRVTESCEVCQLSVVTVKLKLRKELVGRQNENGWVVFVKIISIQFINKMFNIWNRKSHLSILFPLHIVYRLLQKSWPNFFAVKNNLYSNINHFA